LHERLLFDDKQRVKS